MKKRTAFYFIFYFLWQPVACSDCELCSLMNWGTWEDCNRDCGGGTRTRYREVCCPKIVEYDICVTETCPRISLPDRIQREPCNERCYNGGVFNRTCICQPGWNETCCQSQCEAGYFGQDCKFECKCPEDTKCDKGNGVCLRAEPFTENKTTRFSTTTNIIIGSSAGGFILVLVIVVTICFKTKQKKRKGYENDTSQAEKFWPCAAKTVIGNPSSADEPENHYDEIKCIAKGNNTKKKGSFKKSFTKESKKLKKQTSIESTTIYQGLGLDYIDDGYQTLTSRNKEQVQNPNYMTPQLCDDTASGPMEVISSMVTDTKIPRYLSMAGQNTGIARHENPYVSMYNDEQ